MAKAARRGYQPKDEIQFGKQELIRLSKAGDEVQYLLDRGYQVKPVTTFVGNHYMFSERQRLSLARSVCPTRDVWLRRQKRLGRDVVKGKVIHIDGFNTIITLEVALSGSPILICRDGCVRDLAGLRGTYHIIEATYQAVTAIMTALERAEVREAIWYLDAPVSNSGRLKQLIQMIASDYRTTVRVIVLPDVDRTLEPKECVVTSDAIILSKCKSFWNLNEEILLNLTDQLWEITI